MLVYVFILHSGPECLSTFQSVSTQACWMPTFTTFFHSLAAFLSHSQLHNYRALPTIILEVLHLDQASMVRLLLVHIITLLFHSNLLSSHSHIHVCHSLNHSVPSYTKALRCNMLTSVFINAYTPVLCASRSTVWVTRLLAWRVEQESCQAG